jgi:hypothetical protein
MRTVSVGIEAAVRPICGKERRAQITEKLFHFYFLIITVAMGKSYYHMHESRTRIIHSGTVVGHHCPRSQITEKVSARLITLSRWLFACPSVEFLI